jgi:tripartite-type tricarboxylate transporter receptor subunit TctC
VSRAPLPLPGRVRSPAGSAACSNVLLGAVAAFAAIILAFPAAAQSYPSRPIKLIVPITAGSGTDVLARALADKLSVSLGQPVVVENRPGAGGALGTAFVAKAAPDGYTFLVTSSALTAAPAIYASLSYDPVGDFAGVTPLADLGTALVTSPSKGLRTVQDLVTYARAKQGRITYGSSGIGGASHMTTEKFRTAAGFQGVHVPYRGALEAITDAMTGRIDFMTAPLAAALPLIQDNRLIALAVPSRSRSSLLPAVPTIAQAGLPAASYESWVGMVAPKTTPPELIHWLQQAIVTALQTPELRSRFAATGSDIRFATPEAFDALIKDEVASNKTLAIAAGIKAN